MIGIRRTKRMERKIQLMETYVDIDLGNPPFLKLDGGVQIPYSLIKGLKTGRPIPNAFKLYGASFGGTRNGLFRYNGGYHLYFFENEFNTLHLDLNSFLVGKFKITKLIIGVENPDEISKAISERLT
jgi:hypothetical protein